MTSNGLSFHKTKALQPVNELNIQLPQLLISRHLHLPLSHLGEVLQPAPEIYQQDETSTCRQRT